MLERRSSEQLEFFMCGSLRDLVPDDHVLARVDRVLNLSWLHDEVAGTYAPALGRPAIDPKSALRLMLAGFLLGIVHDRRLMREAQVNLAIRWFAGFGQRDRLPDHSSLTRIRQRWGAERFRRIFERTVRACIEAGIAKGEVVHVDASLIRADVSWDSLVVRHVDAVTAANGNPGQDEEKLRQSRNSKKTGKFKKVCLTDPDASMATNGRNRRLEPSYKQHGVVDDQVGVVLDVEATSGEVNEGEPFLARMDAVAALTGTAIKTVTADAGYAYAKLCAGLEERDIAAVIPAKAEPIRSPVPMRRFRYDALNDVLKCPRGKKLKAGRAIKHGRFFTSRARDCRGCDLAGLCLSKGRVNKAVVLGHDYPALLRARRRRERWSDEDRYLYQRHRWRSEGFDGEAKASHGLSRAVRRGLQNMRIQAFLTAAAINLKRLAAALILYLLHALPLAGSATGLPADASSHLRVARYMQPKLVAGSRFARPSGAFLNGPRVRFQRNALAHAGKSSRRVVSAFIATAFAQPGHGAARTQWRLVADQMRGKLPKLAALMDGADEDVLAYTTFPAQYRAKLHSTKPIERLNGEIKRRTDVVGIFPNEAAIRRLVGAILREQTEEWAVQGSRYMTLETLAPVCDDPIVSLPAAQTD